MVNRLAADKKSKTVDIKLDLQELFVVIQAMNQLVGHKEGEMNKFNADPQDREQYTRYKKILNDLQQAKGLIK